VDLQWPRDRFTIIGMLVAVVAIVVPPSLILSILFAGFAARRGETHWLWAIWAGVAGMLLGIVVGPNALPLY
jgi:hypothetical protein